MYHKQAPTHCEYHYKQYMQVCALHKPQARLCLLASDNLTAKRCTILLGEPGSALFFSALSQARRGPTHPVTVMFYTPRGRAAIRNPWP